ncbi:3-methyl-2-oxobutanoate hydroxymethyltransferase [Candidatus Providencia siddallii]|uniref:3-methyl-2-oxobutanoate hydroxymethyltransferase n=1 Tax=Candidatus Providencia siddallii TaxID=1715285 RepID=A0ABM9NNH8_9GAMM
MKSFFLSDLFSFKKNNHKFAAITAYDYSFSKLFSKQGINVMLVGDSLGMTIQGKSNTLSVTINQIAYHTRCVRKGAPNSFIIADMPFMSFSTLEKTYSNAATLIKSGANIIKIEGYAWLCETIRMLTERSVPVCGHIGLTPQAINLLSGYKIQGRDQKTADKLIKDSIELEKAGMKLLVLECVPSHLAKIITKKLSIPVIGIGAGSETDGQLIVMQDALGITNNPPKFTKNFLIQTGNLNDAISLYIQEVENGIYPDQKHSFI